MKIYGLLLLILWIIFVAVWLFSAVGVKRNTRRTGFMGWVGFRIVFVIIVIIVLNDPPLESFFYRHSFIFFNPVVSLIGVIVCALGIAFAIWARFNLGRNWGMPMSLKENPELVTSGPYKYVRHPIYTGMLFAMLGSTLVVGIFWFIVLVVSAIYFIYSARTEEKLMLKEFPDQYPEYMKRTKMLIPFVF